MKPKLLRSQIRNVLDEMGREILSSGIGTEVQNNVSQVMNARLDKIEDFVKTSLTAQEKRSKAVQSFLINEVMNKMQSDLFNANVTVDAIVEVLAEAGLNIENFAEKVDAKKLQLADLRKKEADEKMQNEMKERAEAEKAKSETTQT